jgi:hypothetical protein
MSNNDVNNQKIKKKGNNRQLFYGVIAISTFIIMVVGATFAYFSANTNSADSSVKTGSTKLQLEYISYGSGWSKSKLIPVDTNVAEYSVEKQDDTTQNKMCMDDFGNEICSLYVFQVKNTSNSPQNVSVNIVSESNEFGSLYAMLYEIGTDEDYDNTIGLVGGTDPDFALNSSDVDNDSKIVIEDSNSVQLFKDENGLQPIYVNRANVKKTLLSHNNDENIPGFPVSQDYEGSQMLADSVDIPGITNSIDGSNIKTFMVVLYIKNKEENQNDSDSEKNFTGRIVVSTSDGSTGVSGSIGAAAGSQLQGSTTTETTEEVTTQITT